MTNPTPFNPPTPLPLPVEPVKPKKRLGLKIAGGVIGLSIIASALGYGKDDDKATATTDTATAQVAIMDAAFEANRSNLCGSLNDVLATGITREVATTFAVGSFVEAYEEDGTNLAPEAVAHFRTLLASC